MKKQLRIFCVEKDNKVLLILVLLKELRAIFIYLKIYD